MNVILSKSTGSTEKCSWLPYYYILHNIKFWCCSLRFQRVTTCNKPKYLGDFSNPCFIKNYRIIWSLWVTKNSWNETMWLVSNGEMSIWWWLQRTIDIQTSERWRGTQTKHCLPIMAHKPKHLGTTDLSITMSCILLTYTQSRLHGCRLLVASVINPNDIQCYSTQ